jgi:UDP-N-acetylmuramate dehydrogenase
VTLDESRVFSAIANVFVTAGIVTEVESLLAPFTTFGIGGPAAILVRPTSVEQLLVVAEQAAASQCSVRTIGQGSNLLVADAGFRGIVVILGGDFASIDEPVADGPDNFLVRAGGAVKLPILARHTVAHGLRGFEWAVGVPGSIGGAIRMNAGGHGSDMAASTRSVTVVSMETASFIRLEASELGFGYRSSLIAPSDVVASVELSLLPELVTKPEADAASVAVTGGDAALREIVKWRREHQPGGANCGSVFTNPVGDSAGRLIDAAGLKGYRVGSVSISTKHANFIQADLGAKADDVWALIAHVQTTVLEHFGVSLHPEVQTLGQFKSLGGPAQTQQHPTSEPKNPESKKPESKNPEAETSHEHTD